MTAADRPSVTDNARAETHAWETTRCACGHTLDPHDLGLTLTERIETYAVHVAEARRMAAGRAETTTATDEDASRAVPSDPMANVLDDCRYCQGTGMATLNPDEEPGSHICVPSDHTATTEDAQTGTFEAILAAHRDEYDSDCGMYFGCSCGWDNDDIGSNQGYVEHVAGLLATARTRDCTDLFPGWTRTWEED